MQQDSNFGEICNIIFFLICNAYNNIFLSVKKIHCHKFLLEIAKIKSMVLLHSLLLLQSTDIFSAIFISRAIIEKLGKRICHKSKIFFQSIRGRQIKPLDLCSAVKVTSHRNFIQIGSELTEYLQTTDCPLKHIS